MSGHLGVDITCERLCPSVDPHQGILVMEEALTHREDIALASGHAPSSLSVTQDRCDGHMGAVAMAVATFTQQHQLPLLRKTQLCLSVQVLSNRGQSWVHVLPQGDQLATWWQASYPGLPPSCQAQWEVLQAQACRAHRLPSRVERLIRGHRVPQAYLANGAASR